MWYHLNFVIVTLVIYGHRLITVLFVCLQYTLGYNDTWGDENIVILNGLLVLEGISSAIIGRNSRN